MTRAKRLLCTAAGLFFSAVAMWPAFPAQDSRIPNFSPDSVTGWIAGDPNGENPIGQDFISPESGPGPVSNDKAHPHVDDGAARRDGKQPTYRVADLTNPILLPWVRDALRKENARALSGKPDFTPKERCWPIGVPGWLLYPVRPVWFLQTPKEVTMIWEEDHMVRHVYLNAAHTAHPKPSWFGESVGHYENGDTLVVDTIGLNDKTFVDSYRTPHTTQLHVVERYRLADGGKALDVAVHVEDAGAFTTAWNARQRYHLSGGGPQTESSCAENNSSWFGYDIEPIPQATRPDF
jgi:hypothetical protein